MNRVRSLSKTRELFPFPKHSVILPACLRGQMKLTDINLIIDFDSTLVKLEGLEELAEIALKNNPHKNDLVDQIRAITNQGMAGEISFQESLQSRLQLFSPKKEHLAELVNLLTDNITDSIVSNNKFFRDNAENIYVISGGFREWIIPVMKVLGVNESNLLANEFVYDENDEIIGINKEIPLTQSGGKAQAVKSLSLTGTTIIIGDGYTDYEIKQQGYADMFVMFEENVKRPEVAKLADSVADDWEQILEFFTKSDQEGILTQLSLQT